MIHLRPPLGDYPSPRPEIQTHPRRPILPRHPQHMEGILHLVVRRRLRICSDKVLSARIQARCCNSWAREVLVSVVELRHSAVHLPPRRHALLRSGSRFNFKCAVLLCAAIRLTCPPYPSNCKIWASPMPRKMCVHCLQPAGMYIRR